MWKVLFILMDGILYVSPIQEQFFLFVYRERLVVFDHLLVVVDLPVTTGVLYNDAKTFKTE